MKISLDSLTVIDAIGRRGSFAGAAEELHRVPSAITYSVNKLEQDLGVQIFDRSGHRAQLTVIGRQLLREGRDLLVSAMRLQTHVHHIAQGWEPELRLAVGDLVLADRVQELVFEFFQLHGDRTRIRQSQEVYGGCWDALASDRVDVVIGAPPGVPPGGGFLTQHLTDIEFVFVVPPEHPLARMPEPLSPRQIQSFRAVSAADSSRNLPSRTSGLLSGQQVFTVHDTWQKRLAHIKGLGVGYMPTYLVADDIARGRLKSKRVTEPKEKTSLLLAWTSDNHGKALDWFREKLATRSTKQKLFADLVAD